MVSLTHCRRIDSIFQNMSRRAQSIPEPQKAFIAFIAFMGAMAGVGSVPERREAREILEATAATRQLMVGSCNRQPPYSWKSDTTTKPWTSSPHAAATCRAPKTHVRRMTQKERSFLCTGRGPPAVWS